MKAPEINASSMADIAFLLLIFFLVTTTLDAEKGIVVTLPPYSDNVNPAPENERNVLEILVNGFDELLVEKKRINISELKDETIKHITNGEQTFPDENYAISSQRAIVSLQNDSKTTYKRYIEVYNEIRAAYNEVRNTYAMKVYGKNFNDLPKEQQAIVREIYPLKLSEAELTTF